MDGVFVAGFYLFSQLDGDVSLLTDSFVFFVFELV